MIIVCLFAKIRYASFDYEEGPMREADVIRLDIIVTTQYIEDLARVVPRD